MQTVAALTAPGWPEIVVILLIFILLFGAKKLPELGSSVGRSIKNLKRGLEEGQTDDAVDEAQEERDETADGRPAR
jgi:sec-independent protein translocase protein TatA